MRVITLVLALLAVAMARPQFRLTEKEYEGFQAGLDGRIPVAITSGQLLYSAVDESPNNFVVVDFGGAGLGEPRSPPVGGASGQGVLAFVQGVAEFARTTVEDIVGGIGQVAEDTFEVVARIAGTADDDDFDVDRTLISPAAQLPLDGTTVEARAVIIVDDTAGAPVIGDESTAIATGINDFGQGVLAFGQGVAEFASQAVGDLGQVAEDTLQGIADLVGDERTFAPGPVGGVELPLDITPAEPTAVIVLDALPVFESGVASFRSLETVTIPAADVVSVAASTPEPSTAGIETTTSVAETATAAVSAAISSTVTEAVSTSTSAVTVAAPEDAAAVPVADLRSVSVVAEDTAVAPAAPEEAIVAPPPAVTEAVPTSSLSTEAVTTVPSAVTEAVVASSTAVAEPIDDTLNEIVPAAPKAEENANALVEIEKTAVAPAATDLLSAPAAVEDAAAVPIAESRSAPVAAEDIAVAPAAPEEAIVAPPAPVVGVALIRRKRQFEDEEPVSNARQIGTGLGTFSGLFGSTVGRFMDSTVAAFVEMIDGLEGLGTITLDQIENSFDDDPNNDFIRR